MNRSGDISCGLESLHSLQTVFTEHKVRDLVRVTGVCCGQLSGRKCLS